MYVPDPIGTGGWRADPPDIDHYVQSQPFCHARTPETRFRMERARAMAEGLATYGIAVEDTHRLRRARASGGRLRRGRFRSGDIHCRERLIVETPRIARRSGNGPEGRT